MTHDEPQGAAPAPRIELNGPAPDFHATTTHGVIDFHEWKRDKWTILFSHPADFTPVCTTEFVEMARRWDELDQKNVKILGNSVDSIYAHIAWVRDIESKFDVQIKFPVIADLDQKVSQLYGMVHEPSSVTAAVRCVYFIDPNNVVRAMIYYPLNIGRNFDEVVRVIDALQTVDEADVACPANWEKGKQVIVPPPTTQADALERVKDKSVEVTDWYLSKKTL